jgi:uncharacterized membrane protein
MNTKEINSPARDREGVRRLIKENVATVLLDIALPMAVYYGLRAAGVDQWWALMLGIVAAVPRTAFQLVKRR